MHLSAARKPTNLGFMLNRTFGSAAPGFPNCTDARSFSTLAQEVARIWQHHFGKAPWGGCPTRYHYNERASKMHEIDLHPFGTEQLVAKSE